MLDEKLDRYKLLHQADELVYEDFYYKQKKSFNWAEVEPCFYDIEKKIIEEIKNYDYIVGCVAWLTNRNILSALAEVKNVSIVVQKEDFLRPDIYQFCNQWKHNLLSAYKKITFNFYRYQCGNLVRQLSHNAGDISVTGIRCAGLYNREKKAAIPRMHHKFLVFCDVDMEDIDYPSPPSIGIVAKKVVTGSYNFTENGNNSIENVMFVESNEIASQYYYEWERVFAISEPLNWKNDWVAPEYRIGT